MKQYKALQEAMRGLIWLGQFGLDLLMPLLLCLLLCWWLNARMGLPGWIYLPGFFLGLGGGFATALRFYRATLRKTQQKPTPPAFNDHT